MKGAATATKRSVSIANGTSERAIDGTVGPRRDGGIAGSAGAIQKYLTPGTNVRRLRLQPRKRAVGSVVLSVDGRFTVAKLVNVSETGAGLHTQVPLDTGRCIRLHFADGRVVTGTVCWAEGTRAGIEFGLATARLPLVAPSSTISGGLLAGLWQRLTGDVSHREPSQRLIERACRKNGMAWLAGEEADQELGRSGGRTETECSRKTDENTK